MKKYAYNEITPMQYICLIHGAQVGVGLLSLPGDLAKVTGTDGWISVLIGWLVAVISSVLIVQVMKKHPEETLFDLLPRYFGKVVGKGLHVVVVLYFIISFLASVLASVNSAKLEMLQKTPDWLVTLLFLIPIYTLARNQLRVLGRYAELTFWAFIWLMAVYLYPVKYGVWLNLLPVLKEGWLPVLIGTKKTALSFLGFETAFLLYPFLKNQRLAIPGIVIGNTLTLIVYLVTIVVCYIYFSPDDITSYLLPTLKVVKVIEFRYLERFEVIFFVCYLYMLSRIWVLYLYYGVFGTSQLIGKQDHRPVLRIVLAATFVLSWFFTPTVKQLGQFQKVQVYLGVGVAYVFPLFLLLYTRLFDALRKER
jgi:spore germination protein (amino acid permease)